MKPKVKQLEQALVPYWAVPLVQSLEAHVAAPRAQQ